ncbi:DNA-binding protein WhiA [Anaeromassilibacillus senegalensis]|uniref:DNA-binding protein WhiA n=1 Tax=Anaeromassilibacillus senegalensis TaxID=1673717 RepID=UPI0006837907|nr:DNA-binding protein WhiA [Anaeromassilibacillus senegalensis]
MSFASDAKNEMCKVMPQNSCCQKAECYGLLLFGRSFSKSSVCMVTENAAAARCLALLAAQSIGVIADVRSVLSHRKENKNTFTITIEGDNQRQMIQEQFGHTFDELNLRIRRSNLPNECCVSAFLRGAFLCCGSVTDPNKDYHLEFVAPYHNLAKDLVTLLEVCGLDLQPGLTNRKGSFVVYIKGSERVTDLLAFLGAQAAAMELMQIKMLKEVRNSVNRKTNFETANLDKTASAAAKQLLAIQRIVETTGLGELPEELQELAELRRQNPDMSLRELGQILEPPLSRSGVNHRLQRIVDFAEQLPDRS